VGFGRRDCIPAATDEGMHHGELPRMIELEAGNALSCCVTVGSASFRSYPAER
jgi:hypothetical protein